MGRRANRTLRKQQEQVASLKATKTNKVNSTNPEQNKTHNQKAHKKRKADVRKQQEVLEDSSEDEVENEVEIHNSALAPKADLPKKHAPHPQPKWSPPATTLARKVGQPQEQTTASVNPKPFDLFSTIGQPDATAFSPVLKGNTREIQFSSPLPSRRGIKQDSSKVHRPVQSAPAADNSANNNHKCEQPSEHPFARWLDKPGFTLPGQAAFAAEPRSYAKPEHTDTQAPASTSSGSDHHLKKDSRESLSRTVASSRSDLVAPSSRKTMNMASHADASVINAGHQSAKNDQHVTSTPKFEDSSLNGSPVNDCGGPKGTIATHSESSVEPASPAASSISSAVEIERASPSALPTLPSVSRSSSADVELALERPSISPHPPAATPQLNMTDAVTDTFPTTSATHSHQVVGNDQSLEPISTVKPLGAWGPTSIETPKPTDVPTMSNTGAAGSSAHATVSSTKEDPALDELLGQASKRDNTTNLTLRMAGSRPSSGVRKRFMEAPIYGGEVVTVFVGAEPDRKAFRLHEALAIQESAFIKDFCEGEWDEDEEKVIYLSDHDPEHFELFFLFTYARNIFSTKEHDLTDDASDLEWTRLVHAWALGDHLLAVDFKDAVMDAILDMFTKTGNRLPPVLHRVIYGNVSANTLLRRLAVDIAAWRWDTSLLKAQKSDSVWHGSKAWTNFFIDLALALHETKEQGQSGKPPFEGDTCAYHEHRLAKALCYKTKFRFGA